MKTPLIPLAFVFALAAVVSAQQTPQAQVDRQKGLVKTLMDFSTAEDTQGQVKGWKEWFEQLVLGKPVSSGAEMQIMRQVEGRMKPVPIIGGSFAPQFQQAPFAQYRALTAAEERILLERAASVAQIEVGMGPGSKLFLPRGTGFVVNNGLIATNCHVLELIAAQGSDGNWNLQPGVQAHFADGPGHEPAREFAITGIAGIPTTPGLDVVLLRVGPKSIDGTASLPKPLTLRAAKLTATWPAEKGLAIALVGYPSIDTATGLNFAVLRQRGKFGKIYSPGAVTELEAVQSVDILNHIANTEAGSSGSPLFSLDTFEVIGVHNCCTAAGNPAPSKLPCAQILKAEALKNHAIAASTIMANVTLKPLL